MATGGNMLLRARQHIGERYEHVLVRKDNPNWRGPWDCSEFVSWLVYQEGQILYGCEDDTAPPARAKAYTGAWRADCQRLGQMISADSAAATPGAILLRYPLTPGAMGHIVVCDGGGGTVEARGRAYGVCAHTVHDRHWDCGILIPGFLYNAPTPGLILSKPKFLYFEGAPNMSAAVVTAIQKALLANGINPGAADGVFGPDTASAVVAFQEHTGLVADGEVGTETATKLGVMLG